MLLMNTPPVLTSTLWGLLSGSALVIGALIGYYKNVSLRATGMIMAFGSGVLVSALAFDLMNEAFSLSGVFPACIGFIFGALIYTVANYFLSRSGARHRKRSGHQQLSEKHKVGSGTAIALGALIDGIPESIAIGVSMIEGSAVSIAAVFAIFLSNIPEALSSTLGMKKAGRSPRYIFGIWISIMLISGAGAFAGYTLFAGFGPTVVSGTIAFAAGGILAMLSSTMIPEAYEEVHDLTGMITGIGFLAGIYREQSFSITSHAERDETHLSVK